MATTKFESLPYDLLFQVVYLLSVADILRLRQVSQRFRRLTYDRTVWANAYRKSSTLRPPGPFPSQSSAHLEHELKKNMKLHANWTSKSPYPVSRRILNFGNNAKAITMTLALGRYLLVLGYQGLKCYDLDSSVEALVSRPIASYDLPGFDAYYDPIVDTSTDEHEHAVESQLSIVCALLLNTEQETNVILLDLHILHDTARFYLRGEVAVPNIDFLNSAALIGNFLFLPNDVAGDSAVLHVVTCQLYYLPPCDVPSLTRDDASCVLTSTHLLVLYNYHPRILEAFLLPDSVSESEEISTRQRAVLTRSHIIFPAPDIESLMLFLSSHTTHTHSSSTSEGQHGYRDHSSGSSSCSTTSITILSQFYRHGGGHEFGFLDIVLYPPADGEGTMTARFTPGPILHNRRYIGELFTGTVQRGCARIITSTGWAITVNLGEVGRSIMATELDMEEGEWAWDGLRGRQCKLVSQTFIEIYEYV